MLFLIHEKNQKFYNDDAGLVTICETKNYVPYF